MHEQGKILTDSPIFAVAIYKIRKWQKALTRKT